MIDLKTVAKMAKQDAEARAYVTRVYQDSPEGPLRWLAVDAMAQAEALTENLAKRAAPDDQTH